MLKIYLRTITKNVITFTVFFMTVMGFSHTTYAADKQHLETKITAASDVKPLTKLTDKESQAVALAAGRLLHHVDAARQAIADKKKNNATQHINQGLKLVKIIKNTVPKHKITTSIKSGNISYDDKEVVPQRYVAIYDEQHVEDIVVPVLQARKEKKAKDKDKKKASEVIAPLEDFSMFQHTSMKLDIVLAGRMLEVAKRDLNNGKNEDARNALLSVQNNGVTFMFESVELPLVEAADNLMLAKIQVLDDMHEEALVTLRLASDDLKKYEALTGENRAEDVRKLHQSIDKLTQALEGQKGPGLKKAMADAKKQIASYWDTVVKWMKK